MIVFFWGLELPCLGSGGGPQEEFADSAGRNGLVETVSAADGAHAPQAAILFDKLHVMRHMGEALDEVRKSEYRRLAGRDRRYIKGQKYTLLSRKENLTLYGKRAVKTLFSANNRLNTAYVLKGEFWANCDEAFFLARLHRYRTSSASIVTPSNAISVILAIAL
jgi:hypothetical protein